MPGTLWYSLPADADVNAAGVPGMELWRRDHFRELIVSW
jgi:hypothetical protein